MLSQKYKLSRKLFPRPSERKIFFTGNTLRVLAYFPAALRFDAGRGHVQPVDGKAEEASFPRFAVVVPKRLSDGAVMRNGFKRAVLDLIGKHMAAFRTLPYRRYVLFPREHLRNVAHESIEADIEKFLHERHPT